MVDASVPLYLAILLFGVCAGLLIAWSPRLVVFRLHKRVAELEYTLLSERNKRAARARWEPNEQDEFLIEAMKKNKGQPARAFDNDFTAGL